MKISDKVKTVRRVERNMEYGRNNTAKKAKKNGLWNNVEQKLVRDIILEVLPMPPTKAAFLKPNK